jgi:hypothetical protein
MNNDEAQTGKNDEQADDLDKDSATQAALDLERDNRLFLRAATPLLQARTHESDPSDRVQFALDQAHIALCERLARICRSDLPSHRA